MLLFLPLYIVVGDQYVVDLDFLWVMLTPIFREGGRLADGKCIMLICCCSFFFFTFSIR